MALYTRGYGLNGSSASENGRCLNPVLMLQIISPLGLVSHPTTARGLSSETGSMISDGANAETTCNPRLCPTIYRLGLLAAPYSSRAMRPYPVRAMVIRDRTLLAP